MARRLGSALLHLKSSHNTAPSSRLGAHLHSRCMSSLPNLQTNPDDVVIVAARRTPIGKAKKGSFKDTYGDELLAAAYTAVLEETKLDPKDLGDICVGNVLDEFAAFNARLAQFYSGIPEEVPVASTNRQCSSGLNAVMSIAGNIKNGYYNIGMAAGYESMSSKDLASMDMSGINPRVMKQQKTRDVLLPMGITSENVAAKFGITRQQQDEFALRSQNNAMQAAERGLYDAELIPVTTSIKDETGQERQIVVTNDDGIRPTTIESLSKLKPVFKEDGSTTPGNSSQVSDGAAAVLMMTRAEAQRRSFPILGILRSYAIKGCPPDIMGIGPAVAIPLALKQAGLQVNDVDVYEINEAFASQALYSVQDVGIPIERVNPKGGAIALGHPLGCTGARQVATLLHELKRREQRSFGVISMCLGTGMGAAAVLEYPGSQ